MDSFSCYLETSRCQYLQKLLRVLEADNILNFQANSICYVREIYNEYDHSSCYCLTFFMSFRQHLNRFFALLRIRCFNSKDSIGFWDKLELDIRELDTCR